MEQAIDVYPEREPRFKALIPFFVFLVFYLGLSIWAKDFYCVPMPVAFLIASASALLLDRRRTLAAKIEVYAKGMGDSNIMIMCLIFILAGVFACIAKAMGAVDATVLIARNLIPGNWLLCGFFLISCFISLAIGTSCGTIAALTPIAIGLVKAAGVAPELMIGAVIGGAMFGDNMSMISDTTIAATRTQGVAMRDKFLMNFKMILPAAVGAVILYWLKARGADAASSAGSVSMKHILAVLPYIVILAGALAGGNVMALLFFGTVAAVMIGIFSGTLTFWTALAEAGKGTLGMSETLIVAILAGGLLRLIQQNGGIKYLRMKIEKAVSGQRGCEFGVVLLVAVVNLFTANNTVAIVISGPIAKALSVKYHCDPRRIASILDTMSCVVQGLIPYGAQILIATGIAKNVGVEVPSLALITSLYYPLFLMLALIFSIVVKKIQK